MEILKKHHIEIGHYRLTVDRLFTEYSHFFDRGARKSFPTMVYITGGIYEIHAISSSETFRAGDLVYLPIGLRYHSRWTGTPEISHYCVHMYSEDDLHRIASDIPLQRIDALSTPETGERMAEIFRLASMKTTVTDLRALGIFFNLYADVHEYLRREPSKQYPSALFTAMKYIEENFTREITMRELEAVTFLGESRIYHLFQSQLGTTPLKYRNRLRIEKAAELLSTTHESVDAISDAVGFTSTGYFRQIFKEYTGFTPYAYAHQERQGGKAWSNAVNAASNDLQSL